MQKQKSGLKEKLSQRFTKKEKLSKCVYVLRKIHHFTKRE